MWRHVSTHKVIIRPIIEPRLRWISTFSYCFKHFGIPKVCSFTWCTLNMVQ